MKIDYSYTNTIDDIFKYGYDYEDPNRKGTFRKELEIVILKHLRHDGYPIITARKTFFKGAVGELLLFLKGSTDIRDYWDYGIRFWNKDTKNHENKLSKYPISKYVDWVNKNKNFRIKIRNIQPFVHSVQLNNISEPILTTKRGEKYYIKNKVYDKIVLQFINGGEFVTIKDTLRNRNNVTNPYQISKLNVACIGKPKNIDNNIKKYIYSVWSNMIARCYDDKRKSYVDYGAKGVIVNNRWLCFEYFLEDFITYENFSYNLDELKKYHLDKDFNGDGYEYSYEKCNLIPKDKNISGIKEVVFEFENIETGEIIFTDNIWKFIKDKKLGKSAESSFYWLLNGKLKTCKKWKCNSFSPKKYDMGKIYGYQYEKQYHIFDNFKENPLRTDLIVNSWQLTDLKDMALIPCHYDFQLVGANDGFMIVWNQRSTDFLLGTPINVQFYYLMGLLLEQWSGHRFNGIVGTLKKVHLYDNGFDLAQRILDVPKESYYRDIIVDLNIDESIKQLPFEEFIKHITPSNFKINNYNYTIDDKVEMLTYKKE